jgi:hypothetical protein
MEKWKVFEEGLFRDAASSPISPLAAFPTRHVNTTTDIKRGLAAPTMGTFQIPGNRDRFGDRLWQDETAVSTAVRESSRACGAVSGSLNRFQPSLEYRPLELLTRVGQWELIQK